MATEGKKFDCTNFCSLPTSMPSKAKKAATEHAHRARHPPKALQNESNSNPSANKPPVQSGDNNDEIEFGIAEVSLKSTV